MPKAVPIVVALLFCTCLDISVAEELLIKAKPNASLAVDERVFAITTTQNGDVWLSTEYGFVQQTKGENILHPVPLSGTSLKPAIAGMMQSDKNRVLIGTQYGLLIFDHGKWQLISTADSELPDNSIQDLAITAQGKVWLATRKGLSIYNHASSEVSRMECDVLPKDSLFCLAMAPDGTLWVGSLRDGLACYKQGKWISFTSENSDLPSNQIHSLAVAKDGKLWIGTGRGLVSHYEGDWKVYDANHSQKLNSTIICLAIDLQERVWVGTVTQGLTLFDKGSWHDMGEEDNCPCRSCITALKVAPDGRVLVATLYTAFSYQDQKWTRLLAD